MAQQLVEDNILFLDGETITPEQVLTAGINPALQIDLTPVAWERVIRARKGTPESQDLSINLSS